MKVVALCNRLGRGAELARRLEELPVDVFVLVGNSGRARAMFLAAHAVDFLRLGRRWTWAWKSLRSGRLKVTLGTLHDPAVLGWLRAREPDLGLHAAGVIYRAPLIECFRIGILNAHIGLLPAYRGRSVMEWSLLNGDPTGVTTFLIDEGIDTGRRVVLRETVDVSGFRDVSLAKAFLFALDAEMYAKAVERLLHPDFAPIENDVALGRRWYAMSRLFTDAVSELLRAGGLAADGASSA